jgi:hypothetical protein
MDHWELLEEHHELCHILERVCAGWTSKNEANGNTADSVCTDAVPDAEEKAACAGF